MSCDLQGRALSTGRPADNAAMEIESPDAVPDTPEEGISASVNVFDLLSKFKYSALLLIIPLHRHTSNDGPSRSYLTAHCQESPIYSCLSCMMITSGMLHACRSGGGSP